MLGFLEKSLDDTVSYMIENNYETAGLEARPALVLDQALMSDHPDEELTRLEQTGLLREWFPEVYAMVGFGGEDQGHKDLWQHTKTVVRQTVRKLEVRWAALFHDVGKVQTFSRANGKVTFHAHEIVSARLFNKAARRAGLNPARRKHIQFLVRYLGYVESYGSDWTDSAVRRVHRETGDYFGDLVSLARADITTRHAYKRRQHQERMDELQRRAEDIAKQDAKLPLLPKGLGSRIISDLKLTPGPRVGHLMAHLKAAVEAGELPARADYEVYLEYLKSQP